MQRIAGEGADQAGARQFQVAAVNREGLVAGAEEGRGTVDDGLAPFSVPPVKLALPESVSTPVPLSVPPDWVRLWMVSVCPKTLRSPGSTRSADTVALTVTGVDVRVDVPSAATTVKLAAALAVPSLTNSTEPAASCASVKLVIAVPGALARATYPWTEPVTVKPGLPPSTLTAVRSAVVKATEAPW
jgi:hypothetical protein